jgi:hypothetical protein
LLSKPDHWELQLQDLVSHSHHEGTSAIRSALKELVACGYARLETLRGEHGRLLGKGYLISEMPTLTDIHKIPTSVKTDIGENRNSAQPKYGEIAPIVIPDKEVKPDPPKAPQGSRTQKRQIVSEEALGVLRYLNAANQRHYENASQIQTLLNTGVSIHDCRLVIDFGCAVLQAERPEWYMQYFDNVTPFRPANFDKYRARARTWDATARHPATPKRERLPL